MACSLQSASLLFRLCLALAKEICSKQRTEWNKAGLTAKGAGAKGKNPKGKGKGKKGKTKAPKAGAAVAAEGEADGE